MEPTDFFVQEQLLEGNVVKLWWHDNTGTQSVFERCDDYTYVIDNTDDAILADARVGRV